jgi:osmotically-inducible protein OsmY
MHKSFLSLFVNPIRVYSLACVLGLAGAVSGCATESSGERMTDEKVTAELQSRLDTIADLGHPHSIMVQTRNHVVYLNGAVDTGVEKRMAESIAMQITGVTKVENGIAVSHN